MLHTDAPKRSHTLPVAALSDFLASVSDADRSLVRRLFDLVDTEHLDDARALYRAHPDLEKSLLTWALALQDQYIYDKAQSLYQHALHLNPANIRMRNAMGTLFHRQGLLPQALETYQQVLTQDAGFVPTLLNLARLHLQTGHWQAAQASCLSLLRQNGENLHALELLLRIDGMVCDWRQRKSWLSRLQAALTRTLAADSHCNVSLFDLHHFPLSSELRQQVVSNHACHLARKMDKTRSKHNFASRYAARKSTRRIRLGYISPDLRNHPVGNLLWRLFALHDRGRFDVHAYSLSADDGSDYRRKFQADADVFRDFSSLTVNEAARQIYADAIDILVDLGGYTGQARPEILALRPAPLQIMYLGFPGNTGGAFIDYFVTDELLTPPAQEAAMEEACALLPVSSQLANDQQPLPAAPCRRDWGLPDAAFVFCAFHRTAKLEPEVFDVWMRILRQVPDSILWLLPAHPQAVLNLRARAQRRGVAAERLVFASGQALSKQASHDRLACADLCLDTRVFNGHVSTSNALWCGVPVLTCCGDAYAARLGAGLLSAAGLPQLVAGNLREYERKAVHLAGNPGELRRLRAYLEEKRSELPLFDSRRCVENLERAYLAMWQRYRSGERPERLVINSDAAGERKDLEA